LDTELVALDLGNKEPSAIDERLPAKYHPFCVKPAVTSLHVVPTHHSHKCGIVCFKVPDEFSFSTGNVVFFFFVSMARISEYHLHDFEVVRDEQRAMIWDMSFVIRNVGVELGW
jgi:hypothetical protein